VFVGRAHISQVLSALFVVVIGGCGDMGGCAGSGPLPEGGYPGHQTIEGGGQIRLSPSGYEKLTRWTEDKINSSLVGGFCKLPGTFDAGGGGSFCTADHGDGCAPGCRIHMSLNRGTFKAPAVNDQTMFVSASIKIDMVVDLSLNASPFDCSALRLQGDNVAIGGNVAFAVSPADGSVTLKVIDITTFDIGAVGLSGCGVVGDILAFYKRTFSEELKQSAIERMTPSLQEAFDDFLPKPFGVEGVADVSQLVGTNAAGPALLETRMVLGGYANVARGGMSLGLITTINSDANPKTRQDILDENDIPLASEPNRCSPPIPVANFAAPPYAMHSVERRQSLSGQAFALMPAGAFTGAPEVDGDFGVGISETTLNLLGHHIVTSGALCMGIGTSPTFPNLNIGAFNVILPSIGTLQSEDGKDPVLLVGRPQRAIGIKIGENTKKSPALTLEFSHLEIDLYAFLYERYVRLLTMDLSADVGFNLEVEIPRGRNPLIKPVLVGVSGDTIGVEIINSNFVKEKPQELEAALPTLFDVVIQTIGNIDPIEIPSFLGFSVADLSLHRRVTDEDTFLAIEASLRPSAAALQFANRNSAQSLAGDVRPTPLPSAGTAKLRDVTNPAAPTIRDALARTSTGGLPSVTFDVDQFDYATGSARELEWSWNINGGLWREFQSASPLVITDRVFALQGKYRIGLRSRVKGDPHTVSAVTETPVIIDSVGPKVFVDKATWKNDRLLVPVRDAVSGSDVQVAFGSPSSDVPATEWVREANASLSRETYNQLQSGGELVVFARDELGNQTVELVSPTGGSATGGGCGCQSTGRSGAGALILMLIVGTMLWRSGRHRAGAPRRKFPWGARRMATMLGLWALGSVAASLQPGCSCENPTRCEVAADCRCDNQVPFCIDNVCVCSDTVPLGHVGPYSGVAVSLDGAIWISAYAQSHGDLVVAQAKGNGRIPDEAWEWVEGVPDGPVVVSDSKIRNGVGDPGPDVGMYTSIKIAPSGAPMVAYFDVDRGTLRFATKVGGEWRLSDIDVGTGGTENPGDSVVGMYTSLTLRSDNGRPGVAYLAHVNGPGGVRAEVRYAAAQTNTPTGPGDWQVWVVDTSIVPVTDEAHPNFYPLPKGLGLFIDSARSPANQAPVVAYYDRSAGQLKISRFNPTTSTFGAPIVLDGSRGVDVGWSPSLQIDEDGKAHVAYVSATTNDLKYVVEGGTPEIIDDGYRVGGLTVDGLPKPELHFVGDDVNLIVRTNQDPVVVYQDATTQELLFAQRHPLGWERTSLAGGTEKQKWPGAYGFFAATALNDPDLIITSWVINQPINENWVEVFSQELDE
jgi:hypothetical protein